MISGQKELDFPGGQTSLTSVPLKALRLAGYPIRLEGRLLMLGSWSWLTHPEHERVSPTLPLEPNKLAPPTSARSGKISALIEEPLQLSAGAQLCFSGSSPIPFSDP